MPNFHSDGLVPGTEGVVSWNHTQYLTLLSGKDTDGRMGVFVAETHEPGGPPMHVHEEEDEMIHVLSGEIVAVMAGQRQTISTGGSVFIPRGVEHTYRITSPDGARLMAIVTPGGFEEYFPAMADEGLKIPEDMDRINEVSDGFKLRFTGPPLDA